MSHAEEQSDGQKVTGSLAEAARPIHVDGNCHRKRAQFSVATLLFLQTIAAVLAFVTKALGASVAIAAVLLVLTLAIPVCGTIWVANHFQEAHQIGKKLSIAGVVVYIIGVAVTYVLVWWCG